MFQSEILQEKQRVQELLSKENPSTREYLTNAHLVAKEIAKLYGYQLKYANIPNLATQLHNKTVSA